MIIPNTHTKEPSQKPPHWNKISRHTATHTPNELEILWQIVHFKYMIYI